MRRPTIALALALAVAASGCNDDQSQDFAGSETHQAAGGEPRIDDVLVSPPPAIVEMGERTPEVISSMTHALGTAFARLDRKAADGAGGADGTASSTRASASPAAFVLRAAPIRVPGVHIPITEHDVTTSTTDEGQTTVETSAAIADQTVTASVTGTVVPDPAHPGVAGETETSTKVKLCQPGEETAVEVKVKQTRRANGVEVEFEASGTFVQGADGLVSVDGLDIVTAASEPGQNSRVDHLQVSASGWAPRGSTLLSEGATYTVVGSGGRTTEEGYASQILFAGVLAENALAAALKDARERTDSGGLCVLLRASSTASTLAPGDSADIEVEVVDAMTGAPIEDASVSGSGLGGDLAPDSVPSPGKMTFTATGKPDYWAFLEARTARGGDDATVRFNAGGWRFEGVSYSGSTRGPEAVSVTRTWSGQVCGDPFTDAWDVEIQFASPVLTLDRGGRITARPVEDAPAREGTYLLIAPTPADPGGGPGFRLWVDEENPASNPSHNRVEVTNLKPLTGACVAS